MEQQERRIPCWYFGCVIVASYVFLPNDIEHVCTGMKRVPLLVRLSFPFLFAERPRTRNTESVLVRPTEILVRFNETGNYRRKCM